MVELEAKLRVKSLEPVRERLQALGATFLGRVVESNRIIDRPDGTLRRAGRGLRVRVCRDESGKEEPAKLTYKGPRKGGPFKMREELETTVDSADTTVGILRMLGFVPILSYQKRRESWLLGPCRIELDEPPHIGLFVEIEGPDAAAIRSAQSDLGLGDLPHIPESYVRMLWDYCIEHGLTDRVVNLPADDATEE